MNDWLNKVYLGSCEDMSAIPDASIHCCVTSPPYYGLRAYGGKGEIGGEPTLAEYISRLVNVFREVKRVLRTDGIAFLNLGDSYASDTKGSGGTGKGLHHNHTKQYDQNQHFTPRRITHGLKPKDLMMVPARVAIALQDDGWWIRDQIIWHKKNCMPSSVEDRCTSSYELIYQLTKSGTYFADMDAVREKSIPQIGLAATFKRPSSKLSEPIVPGQGYGTHRPDRNDTEPNPLGANLRNVWTIATTGYSEAHFACFPIEIPSRCIRIGSSEAGCCAECGAPYVRQVERERIADREGRRQDRNGDADSHGYDGRNGNRYSAQVKTLGFKASCECHAKVVPCRILDPFMGSGTTAEAAEALGRHWVGYETNAEYLKLIAERTRQRGLFGAV